MKYKIFFNNIEVAEFETIQEVIDYINEQTKNYDTLTKNMFDCYFKM